MGPNQVWTKIDATAKASILPWRSVTVIMIKTADLYMLHLNCITVL